MQRGMYPECDLMENEYKIQKNKRIKMKTETVPNGANTETEKIFTHNSQVKPGYLSMVLNQGQRLTAASD